MLIIDGKAIASAICAEIRAELEEITRADTPPRLAIVQIGGDESSVTYAQSLMKSADKLGLTCDYSIDNDDRELEYHLEKTKALAQNQEIHGILLLRPLPKKYSETELTLRIPPEKDIDCANPLSMGFLASGQPKMLPPTPSAIVEILKRSDIDIAGKRIAIVGRSNVVGKPLMLMLSRKNGGDATVTLCHSRTKDLPAALKNAEIVVAACGSPKLITGDMLSNGVVVIDAGINLTNDEMVGDVDFDSASKVASIITPVPGGVGPVTRVMLFKNLLKAYHILNS
ncbi:MAG: bifunctional 5,10-methylenetetrahydrofolate dehydrogenase/5,10-methenyltetrahydrofolate cyclohydrolase [candidate division Zixibacteria bacterium]|nr:bifunctional 5,10-methylenetetrahydrofolate dehydrogenase/5,10-methenyltetrahydrofolate cyclohydrolase [Candidatus Tariuqbacter arcticus]